MWRVIVAVLCLCFVVPVFVGCQGTAVNHMEPSMLEKNWGSSFEAAKYNQILNPDAGKNLDPVEGLDADAAQKGVDKYKAGFGEKSGKETYIFNIGQ